MPHRNSQICGKGSRSSYSILQKMSGLLVVKVYNFACKEKLIAL